MQKDPYKLLKLLIILIINLNFFYLTPANATSTQTKPSIKIGMSISLTQLNAEIGENIKIGVKTYFDKINATGGIQGRPLELIALDNKYEPQHAIENLRQLITKDRVLAVIGNNGSANIVAIVPIINEEKILLFGAYPGPEILYKNPPDRYVINLRTSYAQEVKNLIKGLLSAGIKPDEIAFFSQNDAFGNTIYQEAIKALKAAGYDAPESLPYGQYPRNTVNVESALAQILEEMKRPPKVIIMGGTPPSNTKFIQLAIKEFPHTYFIAVAGLVLEHSLNKEANGKIIVSQAAPYNEPNLPAMKEYLEDLKKYGNNQPSAISFFSYLTAKLFVIGLKKAAAKNTLTREGIIDAFESMHNVDIGIGSKISFDKTHHQGFNKNWITIYNNGKFIPFEWSQLNH